MPHLPIERPQAGEFAPYYSRYVDLVPGGDVVEALSGQIAATLAELRAITDQDSLQRYAPGKWSLREVVGHMIDTERIFSYRALRFARNDRTELPGFDQDPYILAANFDRRPWAGLLDEFEVVRQSNVFMFRGLDHEAWMRRGVASQNEMSVRAAAWVIAGHELHHRNVIRERYLGAPANS